MIEGEERLGELVGGRYELRGILGQGGQSVIYRAKDQVDGDEVAIKVLKVGDRDGIDRLYREARALLSLGGTAALRVLHQTQTDDGAACLVTELLRGRDLNEHLAEVESDGSRMTASEILTTFEPIVKTLDAAHDRGIVHRDIKPENIFVIHAAYGGGVRLLDFGFTRFVHARPMTEPGLVAGSPMYLAPEAWAGASDIDHRADVYALGVVLFRVLAGQVPFSGRIAELIKIVRTAPRPSLHALRPDLPSVIDDWVAHALAIERENRFQRASALWKALVTCLQRGSRPPTSSVL
jgi:eukaryotic-like serine/threonine-protein kinase